MSAVEDVVILTGDVHQSYACEIPSDPGTYAVTGDSVAVELIAPGISSPSISTIVAQFIPGADVAINSVFDSNERTFNPWVKFRENSRCGYLLVDFDAERVQAQWWLADDSQQRRTPVRLDHTARVKRGSRQIS